MITILDSIPVLKFFHMGIDPLPYHNNIKIIYSGYYIVDENKNILPGWFMQIYDINKNIFPNFMLNVDGKANYDNCNYDKCFGWQYNNNLTKKQRYLLEPYIDILLSIQTTIYQDRNYK